MNEEVKAFIFGLEQVRKQGAKGMKWYGPIPKEIGDLYGLEVKELRHGYTIAGIYVTVCPQYEIYEPHWLKEENEIPRKQFLVG